MGAWQKTILDREARDRVVAVFASRDVVVNGVLVP